MAIKRDDLSDPERKVVMCFGCQESLVGIEDEAVLHKIAICAVKTVYKKCTDHNDHLM